MRRSGVTAILLVLCCVGLLHAAGNNHALIVQAFDAAQSDFSVPDTSLYKAFWNDPYLLYEMLNTTQYGHRFSLSPIPHERIHLLYADGQDYAGRTDRYKSEYRLDTISITDAPATLDTVCRYLEAFAYGDQSLGIERMTWSDTLVVYLFGHGGHDYPTPNPVKAGHFFLYVRSSNDAGFARLWDTTFGRLLNSVRTQKVVILQQCYGGGFIDDIADSTTTVISASTSSQRAWSVDDDSRRGSPAQETDWSSAGWQGHSEFSFHFFNALRGTVVRPDLYPADTAHPRRADYDNSGAVSWLEAWAYADTFDSRTEDPVFYEPSEWWTIEPSVPQPESSNKGVSKGGGLVGISAYDDTTGSARTVFYVLKGGNTNDLWSYDIVSDSWHQRRSFPTEPTLRYGCVATGAPDGRVYVAKGRNSGEFWRYTPETDSWKQLPGIPIQSSRSTRLSMVGASRGGDTCVYLLHLKVEPPRLYRFDVASSTWQSCTTTGLPAKKLKEGTCMAWDGGDTVYLLGRVGTKNPMFAFSQTSGAFTLLESLPKRGLSGSKAAKKGSALAYDPAGYVYALKGQSSQLWVYDCAQDSWQQAQDLIAAPSGGQSKCGEGAGLAFADGLLWVLKGRKKADFYHFTPNPCYSSPDQSGSPAPSPGEVCLVSGGEPAEPRFSHDGELVAFTRADGDSGPRQVWIAPVSGDDPKQLTKLAGDCAWPVWSPNDALIAFEYEPGGGQPSQVRIVPVSGSSTTAQFGNVNWSHHRPSWTPDGGSLVCEVEDSTGYSQAYLIDAATGGERALTRYHADHTQVTAAGSGHVVYLGVDSAGNGQVYALKPGDSVAVQWTSFALDRDNLSVSESDSTVVFEVESDDGYVRIGRVVGSAGEDTLTSGAADQSSPAVGPDFGVAFCTETTDDGDALCIVTGSGTQALTGDQATREQLHVGPLNEDAEYPIAYVRDDGLYVFTPSGSGGGGMAGSGTLLRLSAEAANPVRGRLVIRWQTPVEQHVRLRVYNTAGQVARTLHDARTPVGAHTSHWDCTDAQGRRLPAGVYFYALETESRRISRKVVISSK